jgi:hypothetical protein
VPLHFKRGIGHRAASRDGLNYEELEDFSVGNGVRFRKLEGLGRTELPALTRIAPPSAESADIPSGPSGSNVTGGRGGRVVDRSINKIFGEAAQWEFSRVPSRVGLRAPFGAIP